LHLRDRIATVSPMPFHFAMDVSGAASTLRDDDSGWQVLLDKLKAQNITRVVCDANQIGSLPFDLLHQHKFKFIACTMHLDIRADATSLLSMIAPLLPLLGQQQAALHLTLGSSGHHDAPSSPRALPLSASLITKIAKAAAAHRVGIGLSPTIANWLERIEDAVRLAMRVNRKDVGVVFNAGDWHAVDGDLSLLDQRMKLAMPKLMAVTWPAVARTNNGPWQPVTLKGQPLDVQPLSRLLVAGGYQGPILLKAELEG